jgi:uncharacterized membrane protein
MLVIITAAGLCLRLYRLGYNDFWFDEIASIVFAQNLPLAALRLHPPLYYSLLNVWLQFFPNNEFYVRMLSLCFSVASIPLCFLLGKKLFNSTIALFASWLMALNPLHVWYAQEARPYSLTVFLSLLSTYLLFQGLITHKTIICALFTSIIILGFYASEFFVILFACQLLLVIMLFKKYKPTLAQTSLYCIPIFVLLSRVPFLLTRAISMSRVNWIPKPGVDSFIFTVENFNIGYNATYFVYASSNLLPLLAALRIATEKQFPWDKKNAISVAILFFLPLFSVFIFSRLLFPIYLDRIFLMFSPYYYILIALGILLIKNTRVKIFVVLFSLLLFVYGNYAYFTNQMPTPPYHHAGVMVKQPVKPAVEFISRQYHESDLIAYTHIALPTLFHYYLGPELHVKQKYFVIPSANDQYWHSLTYDKDPSDSFYLNLEESCPPKDVNHIWLVSTTWHRTGYIDSNSFAVKQWMQKHYNLILEKEFNGILLYKYATKLPKQPKADTGDPS